MQQNKTSTLDNAHVLILELLLCDSCIRDNLLPALRDVFEVKASSRRVKTHMANVLVSNSMKDTKGEVV